ncbi:MAG TPA: hypothetical protein VGO11_26805 [Chthoniobacteraceae bacterium]|jgi:hypothetical protein|nr:hypothetical protein [Chthoniobacteraceae bacterium]
MIYFHMGLSMEERGTLRNNTFFHSDIGRVISDMTRSDANHGRTIVHPLFVLLTYPVGAGLTAVFGSPMRVAVAFNSFIGGVTVALTCLFFLACRVSLRRAVLGALLLGFSSSHLYFGSAPETYIFSCLSIILLVMGLAGKPRGWRWYLPAGFFSFSMLVTNLAFVVITYATAVPWDSWWKVARRVALLAAGVVVITMVLALVQRAIWPSCQVFFERSRVVESESRFTSDHHNLAKVLEREGALLRYVFVYDFFAPTTYVEKTSTGKPTLHIHSNSLSHITLAGRAAIGLWFALLLGALWRTAKSPALRKPLFIGLILCVAYNFFLHTLYGDDLFLYSCNTCFLVVAWMILCVSDGNTPRLAKIIDLMLLLLVSAEVLNNFHFVKALALMR